MPIMARRQKRPWKHILWSKQILIQPADIIYKMELVVALDTRVR